jgi:DNA polymerase-1
MSNITKPVEIGNGFHKIDAGTVAGWLGLFIGPDQVVELRACEVSRRNYFKPHTEAGFFDGQHLQEMAVQAIQLAAVAQGAYFTINPLESAILARCANRTRVAGTGELAGDQNVDRRRWLLIDVDPTRLSGISATDAEKAAALEVVQAIRQYLASLGWPEPIVVDSGNGYHLFYAVDLPAVDGGLVERCLVALAERFDTDKAKVDKTVHNASRIAKIPGTPARKGDATDDRPHRLSKILEAPSATKPVPQQLLEDLAASGSTTENHQPQNDGEASDKRRLDVAQWLSDRGVSFRKKPEPDAKGRTTFVLDQCPFNPEHKAPDSCIMQAKDGQLSAKCFHNSCSGHGWQDFKAAIGKPDAKHWGIHVTTSKKRIRTIEPYVRFPVCCLPPPLDEFVRQTAAALGCDPSFVALPGLAAAAGAIGNARVIELKPSWQEPMVIWAAVVARSGLVKSPAQQFAVDPFHRRQGPLVQAYNSAFDKWSDDITQWAHERKKNPQKTKPPKPVLEHLFVSDATIEKLADVLQDTPRGTFFCRDELAAWFNSFERYGGKRGSTNVHHWLEVFHGRTIKIDRKTGDRRTVYVPRAVVSITGGVTPGVLARVLNRDHFDAGLPARFLFAMPPGWTKKWTDLTIDQEVRDDYDALIGKLLELYDTGPIKLGLSEDARKVWIDFYNRWGEEQAAAEGDLGSAFAKLEAYGARFSLLHHVVSNIDVHRSAGEKLLEAIEPPSVEAGVALAWWFGQEARRVYAILAESDEQRRGRELVEFIANRGGRITARQLYRSNPHRWHGMADAEAKLEELVNQGAGGWEHKPAGPTGGRPVNVFVLAPDTTNTTYFEGGEEDEEDGDGGEGPSTEPLTEPPEIGEFPMSGEVLSVVSGACVESPQKTIPVENGSEVESGGHLTQPDRTPSKPRVSGVSSGECKYGIVSDTSCLPALAFVLGGSDRIALDLETTGLDPRRDRVRLLSLYPLTHPTADTCFLVDCFSIAPGQVFPILANKEIVGHNLPFDLGFLSRLGFEPGKVLDTMFLSMIAHGVRQKKGFHSLAECVTRELGLTLDKELQASNWSGPLSVAQLRYAAQDVAILHPLLDALQKRIKDTGQREVAAIEARCLPALAWLSTSGVAFDLDTWLALADKAEAAAKELQQELDAQAPTPSGTFPGTVVWNWESPAQVKEIFAALGIPLESTDDDHLAAVDHPLAELLRQYRSVEKLVGTYGRGWKDYVQNGRIYPHWRQIGADTGRMACSDPNLQNLPRDPAYRRCFVAPPGRVLIKADYSQIELRIAAKIAGEARMMEAYSKGEDLHALTASLVLGKPLAEVTKEDRQLAKSQNFGLLYGMRWKGFRRYAKSTYGLELSGQQAQDYHAAFFQAYPGLARWHREIERRHGSESRTLTGRRRLFENNNPDTWRLNSPVQGTGADGLKLALALLWERRAECPGAFPVLVVHDEIVIEAEAGRADAAAAWLKNAMLDAMAPLIDPVPVEVETKIGITWGD